VGVSLTYRNINCPVELSKKDSFGVFANSVRMLEDGAEVLIDFCQYSESENIAQVVSRVRVSQDLLQVLRDKLERALAPEDVTCLTHTTPIQA
jgi:hypothetical protein